MAETFQTPITRLAVELSAEECWLVFSHYRPPILWGMRRPYMGKTPEEVADSSRRALERLQERQLIAQKETQHLQMDAWLDQVAQVCSQPEYILLVHVWQRGQRAARRHYLHFQGEHAVEQSEIGRANGDHYRFMALHDRLAVHNHLKQLLDLPYTKSSISLETALPEKLFTSIATLCAHGEIVSAVQELSASRLDSETASQLIAALSDSPFKASLALIRTQNPACPRQVRGLSIVSGHDGLWLFKPDNNQVTCFLQSSEAAWQATLEMLP
ncbi:MAG: hypothetical protein ACOYYS_00330 [Chloroflexota bacterium]